MHVSTHFGFYFFLTSVVEIGFSEVTYNVIEVLVK